MPDARRQIDLVVAADRHARGIARRMLDRVRPPGGTPGPDEPELRRQVAATRPLLERLLVDNLVPVWFPGCLEPGGGFRVELAPDGTGFVPAQRHLGVATARLTYFFAALARSPWGEPAHLEAARHGVAALRELFWDDCHGGLYYEVDARRGPNRAYKDTYTHAFAIKALSEVTTACADPDAAALADQIVEAFAEGAHDDVHGGYHEVVGRGWEPLDQAPAQHNRVHVGLRTFNCQLHLVDALEARARTTGAPADHDRLVEVLPLVAEHMLDPVHHQGIDPYDPDGTPRTDLTWWRTAVSYGHDAERVTVLDRAADTLRLDRGAVDARLAQLLQAQMRWGLDRWRGGVFATGAVGGPAWDTTKLWWVQAESAHAYLTVYALTGDPAAGSAYLATTRWIERHQVDWEHGEWHERVARFGRLRGSRTERWKTPYHIGRSLLGCLSLLRADEVPPRSPVRS